MNLLSEIKLRQYIRAVLRESSAGSDLASTFATVVSAIKDLKGKSESGEITSREAYSIEDSIKNSTFGRIRQVLLKIDTFRSESSFDTSIANSIASHIMSVLFMNQNFDLTKKLNFYSNMAPASFKDRWDGVTSDYETQFESLAPEIKSILEEIPDEILSKISTVKDSKKERLASASKVIIPLKKELDTALRSVTPTLEEPQSVDLIRAVSLENSSLPQYKKIPGLVSLLGIFSDLPVMKDLTSEDLITTIRKKFESQLMSAIEGGSDPSDSADSFISVVLSIPDVVKRLRKMSNISEKDVEAPQDSPLGRIAFPQSRKNKPLEINTKLEDELLYMLNSHFEGEARLPTKYFAAIKDFMNNGWYSEIFKPTTADTVYRGMSVSESWLKNLLGVEDLQNSGSSPVDYDFGKENESSSWTVSKKVATKFAKESSNDGGEPFCVIMQASVAKNPDTFMNSSGLYNVKEISKYSKEDEEIGIGRVSVDSIEWFRNIKKKR